MQTGVPIPALLLLLPPLPTQPGVSRGGRQERRTTEKMGARQRRRGKQDDWKIRKGDMERGIEEMETRIEDEIKSGIEDEIESGIGHEIESGIGDEIESGIGDEMERRIGDEMESGIEEIERIEKDEIERGRG
ncbi:hypothetical protein Pmani_026893 [Petrolisthes manimaculis]|uniref:Uncharacterized protein n=1 Tax=Petrolisthes manimaculis TaxID=1843537 RepID=A0AAE1TZN0_9EUCA|nr:hypothetical protein Pmani_026893 [Petrolisthes manimaculis]